MQSQAKSFAAKVKRFLDLSPFSIPFLCPPGLLNLTNDCILMPSTYIIDFYSGAFFACFSCVWDNFLLHLYIAGSYIYMCVKSDVYCPERPLGLCRPRNFLPASHGYCPSKTLFCALLSKPMFACHLVLYCLPKLDQISMRAASSILSSDMHGL